jgi:two-component system sensor histidine kinase RegB
MIQGLPWHNLRQLMLLRNCTIVGQILAIAAVDWGIPIPLPLPALACVTGFLVLFNLWTFSRLQRPRPACEPEVLGQIVVDIGGLTLLLYFSGGAANPLAGLLLVPLAIAAVSLPRSYTWPVAWLTAACYLLLIFFHVALDPQPQLATGSWVTFAASAALIAYFVAAISGLSRKHQRNLDNESLVRIGALAAGAAHELRSPLNTMAVLVDEMAQHQDGLRQALLSLLNNAADASPQAVEMDCACDSGNLRILIEDRGPGIPSELGDMLGKPFFTTKRDQGAGIGLLLAKTAIHSAGGSLTLCNRRGGGARAEVMLPLEAASGCELLGQVQTFQGSGNA